MSDAPAAPLRPHSTWVARALLAVAVVFLLENAKPLMLPIVVAVAFTFVLAAPVRWLRRRGGARLRRCRPRDRFGAVDRRAARVAARRPGGRLVGARARHRAPPDRVGAEAAHRRIPRRALRRTAAAGDDPERAGRVGARRLRPPTR
jgi:hypothetical protein